MRFSRAPALTGERDEVDVGLEGGDPICRREAQHPADEREVDAVLVVDRRCRFRIDHPRSNVSRTDATDEPPHRRGLCQPVGGHVQRRAQHGGAADVEAVVGTAGEQARLAEADLRFQYEVAKAELEYVVGAPPGGLEP